MKRLKIFSVIAFILIAGPLFSQTKKLDSLFSQLGKAPNDVKRVELLNDIANQYLENNTDKMMEYADKALKLAQQKNIRMGEAESWFNLGNANIMKSDYGQALKSFFNAQNILEELLKTDITNKNYAKHVLGKIYASIGIVSSEQNDYAKSLEYYFKALKVYKETNQDAMPIYNNIGVVYKSQKEYAKALEYYNKTLELQKKVRDNTQGITITNIGNIYLEQGNLPKAFSYYSEALKKFEEQENQRGLAELYNSLGNYYEKSGEKLKAEKSYKDALRIFENINDKYGSSASFAFLGDYYAGENKNKEAISYLEKSSALAQEIGVLVQVKQSEKSLSEIYEKMDNYAEALKHYKKYDAAKDSVNNAENIKNIVREEMKFEMERKAELQKAESEKRQAIYFEKSKRTKQLILFGSLLVVFVLGIVFLIYNRRQLKKTLTLEKDLAEYEQKALHLQMNPHFVFNCLGSISSFIVQNGTDSAIKYLSKFSKLMRLTLEYSKESLIPIDKEIEGLQNYLELEQLRFNKAFDFLITKDPNIEDDMAIPPLLLQPFVENAIMHGIVPKKEKGNIKVNFGLIDDKLVCTVTDDGIGFSKSKEMKENSVTVHKSMALEITRKRLEVIQAFTSKTSKVEIKDIFDDKGLLNGTRIILNLPIQYATS